LRLFTTPEVLEDNCRDDVALSEGDVEWHACVKESEAAGSDGENANDSQLHSCINVTNYFRPVWYFDSSVFENASI